MLYVFRHKPLVTALMLWSLLCLIVVPLSAQNIMVMPATGLPGPPQLYMPAVSAPVPALYRLPVPAAQMLSALTVRRQMMPADLLKTYTRIVSREEEEKLLREAWKEAFGFDVWYPYYKEKEIEGWVRQKFRVRIFRLKGEPQFNTKGLTYSFKSTF